MNQLMWPKPSQWALSLRFLMGLKNLRELLSWQNISWKLLGKARVWNKLSGNEANTKEINSSEIKYRFLFVSSELLDLAMPECTPGCKLINNLLRQVWFVFHLHQKKNPDSRKSLCSQLHLFLSLRCSRWKLHQTLPETSAGSICHFLLFSFKSIQETVGLNVGLRGK